MNIQIAAPANNASVPNVAEGTLANCADFISFAIGGDQYGVDIMAVREIKEW